MKKLFLLIPILFIFSCGNQDITPKQPQETTAAAQKIDSTGTKQIPVWIRYIPKIDSMKGFADIVAVINEKTLQPELRVTRYYTENKDTLTQEIASKVIDSRKR